MDKQDQLNNKALISEVVAKLTYFAKLYNIESLFIVGGFCRELYYGKLNNVDNIEVVSAFHEEAIQFGNLFASEVLNITPDIHQNSGSLSIVYENDTGSATIEFQGYSVNQYMHNQEIKEWMRRNGVDNVPVMSNIYGRNFTVNGLIYSLDDEKIYDPTNRAVSSLEDKVLVSLLPPELLIKYSPLSILKAIHFSLTHDFDIDSSLRSAMGKGKDVLCKSFSQERILAEIVRILKVDAEKGIEMLQKYNLNQFLFTPEIKDMLGDVDVS